MSDHLCVEHNDGCYRCELNADETATQTIEILRDHILPWCQTSEGLLPDQDRLWSALATPSMRWTEWTLDAFGRRDWKIDENRDGTVSVRYRGEDPEARAAAVACNQELQGDFDPRGET